MKISGLAKSVYYYTLSKNDKGDKNKEIIDKIKELLLVSFLNLSINNKGSNVIIT